MPEQDLVPPLNAQDAAQQPCPLAARHVSPAVYDKLLGTVAPASHALRPPHTPQSFASSNLGTSSYGVDPTIAAALEQVSPSRFLADVQSITRLGPRNISGLAASPDSGNSKTVTWISDQFTSLGFAVHTQNYAQHEYGPESNVIAEKRRSDPDEVILVIAHLDDVGHPGAGADDNASGVAAMLEMARHLAGIENERTIRFVAANGEEGYGFAEHLHDERPAEALGGLRGSWAYVRNQMSQGTLGEIKHVIAMDMVGYNPGNNIMGIETNEEFRSEAQWYADQVKSYTSLIPNIVIPAWGSDHVPFLSQHIPTVLIIEHWDTKTPDYHGPGDTPDTLNPNYAAEIIKLNLAVVMMKAGARPRRTSND